MKTYFPPLNLRILGLALGLALLWLPVVSSAQAYPNAWRTYDRFDGVQGNWIYAAVQGPDNALWFGTDRGLLRFDGVWQIFSKEQGFPIAVVSALVADHSEETLWVATSEGVVRFHGNQWQLFSDQDGLPSQTYRSLALDAAGRLWAGADSGLYLWQPDSGAWTAIPEQEGRAANLLAAGSAGDVWLASGRDLLRFHEGRWQTVAITANDSPLDVELSALAPDGGDGLWIGTNGQGLAYLRDGQITWYDQADGLPDLKILSLWQARDGSLWAGTNAGGAASLQNNVWRTYTMEDGLAANYVTAILEDADGVIWFSTVSGISRFDRQSWQVWQDGAAPSEVVSTLLHTGDAIWAGTFGQGLFRFSGEDWRPVQFVQDGLILPTQYLESTFLDKDGALWMGTNGAGVLRMYGGAVSQFTTADGLSGNTIVSVAQTPDGAVWLGLHERGISRWDGETWQSYGAVHGLISDNVQTLSVDNSGRLWVGTSAGVSLLEDTGVAPVAHAWKHYAVTDGLGAESVRAIAQAPDGSMWFATWGGGVSRLLDGVWTTYNTHEGLQAPGVEAIWPQPDGDRIWFGTVSGLSVYDGRTWQNYGVAAGHTLGRVHSLAPGSDGSLFLGTERGIVRFRPDSTPPSASILAVNGLAPNDGAVSIAPDETIRIHVLGADTLTATDELFYLYRLAGYEEDWQSTRNTLITYPQLPEGRYELQLMARDTGLNYSQPTSVALVITPPPSTVWVPWLGRVQAEAALAGVAVLAVMCTLGAYAAWSTVRQRTMQRQALKQRFNPYVAGSPIRDKDMFHGRDALLAEVETAIYHNSIMIHGERRIGKTSLLYQLSQRLSQRNDPAYRFISVFVDLEGTPESEFFHRLMEGVLESAQDSLAHMEGYQDLHYHLLEAGETYTDRHFRRDLRDILEFLNQYHHRQPRLIFLLDEADIMNTYDNLTQQQLRRILQDTFAHNVGAVVSGVNISKSWDRVESPWYNMFVDVSMKPFDRQAAEKLMRAPVAGFYSWDEDAVHYVYAASQGRPHRIQQICLEAVNHMLDERRRRITLQDVEHGHQQVLSAEPASHT